MGAAGGISWLRNHELPVLAAGGAMTAAPLAVRESQAVLDVPVTTSDELATGPLAYDLLPREAGLIAA